MSQHRRQKKSQAEPARGRTVEWPARKRVAEPASHLIDVLAEVHDLRGVIIGPGNENRADLLDLGLVIGR